MDLYFLFVAVGSFLFTGALAALIWLIRSGQLDDLDTPALRMLADEDSLTRHRPSSAASAQPGDPQLDKDSDA